MKVAIVVSFALLLLGACADPQRSEPAPPPSGGEESRQVETVPANAPGDDAPISDDAPIGEAEHDVTEEKEAPPPDATKKPARGGIEGGAGTGAACTISDSNGPVPGGARTDSCPEGQSCACDRQAAYSCAGRCRTNR